MGGSVQQSSWLRVLLGNALVLLGMLAVVGCAGELYYRFIFDSTDSFGLTRVSTRWLERHFQENGAGVRDDIEYPMPKLDSRRRISFLGDSFTAGYGIANVDDRFANRIRHQRSEDWEVHVLAINGLDTGGELESLKLFVENGYELDVLVLVYVLNDISDIVPEWGEIRSRIYRDKDSEGFFVKHSYFFNTLYYLG